MDGEKQGNGGLVVLLAFFCGGLIGSLLGLLFAPMAGRETRERIRDASTDVKDRTLTTAQRAREATTETVTDLVGKGRAQVDDATENVRAVVEAGKTAFVEKKSELANILSREKDEEEAAAEETSS
jgi:gas vesicle protein